MRKNIHIHIHDNQWEESKHPRTSNGKFGTGGARRWLAKRGLNPDGTKLING